MKNSAAGLDGWRIKELKGIPREIWMQRARAEALLHHLGELPTAYRDVAMPMLPKGEGPTALDHQGLSLFSGLDRVLSGAWWTQLKPWCEAWLHPDAHGARAGHDIFGVAWVAQGYIELAQLLDEPLLWSSAELQDILRSV